MDFVTVHNGPIALNVAVKGEGKLIVCVHGFPELWYSWRHQIDRFSARGYTVAALDVRGYGGSSKPSEISAYSMRNLTADVAAVIDRLGNGAAVLFGHDWGAPIVWNTALIYPEKVTAVAGLSVPPPFRGRGRPLDMLRENGITNFYWQYFQTPSVAEREFERDVGLTMRTLLGRGFSDPASLFVEDGKGFLGDVSTVRSLPDWLSEADLAYFTEAYRKSGFRGGLNWYRNIDRNWELTAPWQGAQIVQPSLFIAGANDAVVTGLIGARRVSDMERVLPNLKQKLIIDGAGHWIQQERAAEVNAALIAFLKQHSR